jgi:hypothetical protein
LLLEAFEHAITHRAPNKLLTEIRCSTPQKISIMGPTRSAPSTQTGWKDEVLRFWFTKLPRQQWFAADAALDERIRSRFLDVHRMVAAAPENALLADAKTALAAVIALDQFSHNMFRGTPSVFANDAKALGSGTPSPRASRTRSAATNECSCICHSSIRRVSMLRRAA